MCKNFTRRPCASTCGRTCAGTGTGRGSLSGRWQGSWGCPAPPTPTTRQEDTPSAVDLFTLAQLYRVPVEEFFRP